MMLDNAFEQEASEADWNDSLTALPCALVPSLNIYSLFGLPAAVSTLTALTQLKALDSADNGNLRSGMSADRLQPLRSLSQQSLGSCDISGNAEELLSLPALGGLQAPQLSNCRLQAVPQLTAPDLSSNAILAALQLLRQVDIGFCDLAALPEQLAALTGLTRLTLTGNQLTGDWLHLLPLIQLQYLEMSDCGLTAVSQPLSTLTALTRLDLAHKQLTGGWQHLLPLTQLQYLEMCNCVLSAVPRKLSALTALTRLDLRHSYELTAAGSTCCP
ncbi:hypothetical protein D9Q98_002507 [Chlorella vulgaris]|uniref:Uncharacterized protein n=1 Tax=Chlorella vulgaris TaxID=3077 RepID=A0A9D4TUS9_CHLVU|nr:hypothetical protein D9Q98_002507 [Chlorella vulgaris]